MRIGEMNVPQNPRIIPNTPNSTLGLSKGSKIGNVPISTAIVMRLFIVLHRQLSFYYPLVLL